MPYSMPYVGCRALDQFYQHCWYALCKATLGELELEDRQMWGIRG